MEKYNHHWWLELSTTTENTCDLKNLQMNCLKSLPREYVQHNRILKALHWNLCQSVCWLLRIHYTLPADRKKCVSED